MKKYCMQVIKHLNGKKTLMESVELETNKNVSDILCNDALELCKKYGLEYCKVKVYEIENGLLFWRGTI